MTMTPAQDATALAEQEAAAEIIYDCMRLACKGETPAWVPQGNAIFQDAARNVARKVLALRATSQTPDADSYRNIIDEAMIVRHLGVAKGDARSEFDQILNWEVSVALDPRVSERARALIDQGRPSASAGPQAEAESDLDIVKAAGLKTCLDETGLKITVELYKAVKDLKDASPCLLAMIGSWGDTLDDADILTGLHRQNEMGECFIPETSAHPQPQQADVSQKPICCYCDNILSCAHCGREQPDDSEPQQADGREAVREALKKIVSIALAGQAPLPHHLVCHCTVCEMRRIAEAALQQSDGPAK